MLPTSIDELDLKALQAAVSKILDEAAHPDYAGPEGKKLREEASKLAKQRNSLNAQAHECYENGEKARAKELANKVGVGLAKLVAHTLD